MFTRTTPTWQEEIARKHKEHMKRVDQEGWLKDLFQRADELTVVQQPVKKKGGSNGRAKPAGN